MSKAKDYLVQEVALIGSAGTQIGRTINMANCDKVSVSLVVTTTAATLVGTFGVGGTDDDSRAADEAIALVAVAGGSTSVLPANITYSSATGLVTFASPAAATHEVVMTFTSFPKYFRPLFTYTSGGGTVSVTATVAGWST